MGLPAESTEPQASFQCEPKAGEEGEGWGSDAPPEACTPTPLFTGDKKKKKRKKSYSDFQAYTRAKKHKTYICKPDSGCQGRGIFLTKSSKDIRPGEHMICQVYISRPFIIDGFKFDLRIYVLVTSCDPFRIFVYNEGLARFCTSQYNEPTNNNMDEVCMHLTNYAINKHSENFVRDDDTGSKRKLSTLNKHLEAMCCDTDKVWVDIEDVIIKTLISAHPILKHNYHTCFPNHVAGSACFEILGFDVLLDHRLKPWLLEVNHSPSFTTDSRLDREVKDDLLFDTLVLINLGACDRKKTIEEEKRRVKERLQQNRSREARNEELRQFQAASMEQMQRYEAKHLGGFRRIYPREEGEKYEKYFKHSSSLFHETAASKAREECARQQLQELRLKQEQKGNHRRDLQGESAGERVKPRKAQTHIAKSISKSKDTSGLLVPITTAVRKSVSLLSMPRLPTSSGDTSQAVDVSEEEEMERVNGLIERENLLRDLGVVDQVHRLLQGTQPQCDPTRHTQEAAHFHSHNRHEKLSKMDNLAEFWRQKHPCAAIQRQVSPGAKPCLHYVHVTSPIVKQASISSFGDTRTRAAMTAVPQLVSRRLRCAPVSSDPKTVQSLFIISTAAPLVTRPELPYTLRKAPRKEPQQAH
ncbi:hypothetical protein NFI96_009732 [Prochilodus magdalenae]|nr:hypothetical protein NFI96_009732 [Prochilodus magdalenae]